MSETDIELSGATVTLDPAGVLWMQGARALVVADLHLEKASSLARRRLFLPPYDSAETLDRLARVISRRQPALVVCLGDSFHDSDGASRLPVPERARLAYLQHGRDWIWIAGNHDPDLPRGIGGECCAGLELAGLTFRHEPADSPSPGEVAGHLHPCAKLVWRGRAMRRRAFVTDGERLLLPAFGALAGGLNVLDRAVSGLFASHFRAFLLGDTRLYALAKGSLRPD